MFFLKMKNDSRSHRVTFGYVEVVWLLTLVLLFSDLMATFTYVLIENFCPCFTSFHSIQNVLSMIKEIF